MNSASESKGQSKAYRTIDLVTIATLGVAFGVIFWGWGKVYEPLSALAVFSFPPSTALLAGPWLIAGVIGGLIIRKPGAAFATEFIAAAVSTVIVGGTQWGLSVFASGFVQGIGAELAFLAFAYRRFTLGVACLAGALAAALESVYEWYSYWPDWNFTYKLDYLGFFVVSGIVFAGVGSWLLTRALARAGVLDSFGAGRELVDQV